jgi:hypothetical protein
VIIGTAVFDAICNSSASAAASFLQWDSVAALNLRCTPSLPHYFMP